MPDAGPNAKYTLVYAISLIPVNAGNWVHWKPRPRPTRGASLYTAHCTLPRERTSIRFALSLCASLSLATRTIAPAGYCRLCASLCAHGAPHLSTFARSLARSSCSPPALSPPSNRAASPTLHFLSVGGCPMHRDGLVLQRVRQEVRKRLVLGYAPSDAVVSRRKARELVR